MNVQDILNEVEAEFQIEIKAPDLEISRFEIIREFCYKFLLGFNVDFDNVIKVQLCQNIHDHELIPIINMISSVNSVLPMSNIGLFDIISPTKQFIWAFFEHSLQYYKFCDLIMTQIYDLCNPMLESKLTHKQLMEDVYTLNASTNELMIKIENEKIKLEEARAPGNDLSQEIIELKDIKRAEDNNLFQIMGRKQIILRKQQQALASLNEKKHLLELINTELDRSLRCEYQIENLEKDILASLETRSKINSKIDESKACQVEKIKMKQILEEHCISIDNIHQSIIKLKSTEDLKEVGNVGYKNLEEINQQFLKVQEENKIALEFRLNEIDELRKTLDGECESKVNLSKLEEMEKELKDIHGLKVKMIALNEKATKLKDSYPREELKLKMQEEEALKFAKRQIGQAKALLKYAFLKFNN